MINRILKRPMFRRGGSAGTGITSGLDTPKRGLVDGPGMYSQPPSDDPLDRAFKTSQDPRISQFLSRQPALGPGTLPGFLTSFGLDLASRTPTGKGFSGLVATAAGAAKGPFETFQAAQLTRGAEESDIRKDVFTSALASEYDLKREKLKQTDTGVDRTVPEVEQDIIRKAQQAIFDAEDKFNKPGATEQEKINAQRTIQLNQNALVKELGYPAGLTAQLTNEDLFNQNMEAYVDNYNKAQTRKQKEYLANNQDKTPQDALEEFPLMESGSLRAINYTIQELSKNFFRTQRTQEADGGRIGYSIGSEKAVGSEPLMESIVETEKDTGSVQDLSFTELRARLPNEISNDIVQLLARSKKALLDFANIQTTEDISNFNKLYDVNLTLPQGA